MIRRAFYWCSALFNGLGPCPLDDTGGTFSKGMVVVNLILDGQV